MSAADGALSLRPPGTFRDTRGFGELEFPDEAVHYWDKGLDRVPVQTGAALVMDGRDLVDACARLGVSLPLQGKVFDIGCGTGRWQRFCQLYQGFDISPAAVAYAQRQGLAVHLIQGYGPTALDGLLDQVDWICCFSVFTHIPMEERHDYLEAFHRRGRQLLVDIIPGDGGGDITKWTAHVPTFEQDLVHTGWQVRRIAERVAPGGGATHRYYYCEPL